MARPIFNINKLSLFQTTLNGLYVLYGLVAALRWTKQTLWISFIALCQPALADTRCDNKAATLESIEGVVEWMAAEGQWNPATRGDNFCYGDKIRVLEQRAALRLANDTIVRLQENSVVTLMPEDKGFWVELLQGAGHFLSRTPKQLTVKAAYLNAAIDGTEFVVAAGEQRNRVAVFEGKVRVFNRFGEVALSEGTETSATPNTAPDPARSIRLRDAAEWILHYPPLIIQDQNNPGISALMDQERYGDAFNALNQQNMTSQDATLAASLALVSGRPAEADRLIGIALQQNPQAADARALQVLKTLTAGDDHTALTETTALVQTHPQNVSVLLAHAYALQSQGEIEAALKTTRNALALRPNNLFILARTAELELSTGNTRAARKLIDLALKKAPHHSRLNTLAGFIALNRFANKEAQTYFRTAINSNNSEPLARLGLALALIQKGKIEEGRAEMEMAVLLDPGSSLLRSYLGKTYAAQDQNDWADTQYQLAKNLDPNDPTPWFYQAHLKHEENMPGEALRLITTAIEKNDNRAVYRSRMLLDSDAAARSANLTTIYKSLGFSEAAKNNAVISAAQNPTDFSAHYALALAYGEAPESQILRAQEVLKARILAPPGTKEMNIGADQTGILVFPWLAPSRTNTHEYTSLFTQKGLNADFSSFLGSKNSRGYDWQAQLSENRASISGGEYKYETDGFRENNDLSISISEGTLHIQAADNIKLFIGSSKREDISGDLVNAIDSMQFDDMIRRKNTTNHTSVGIDHKIGQKSELLMAFSQYDVNAETKISIPVTPDFSIESEIRSIGKEIKSEGRLFTKISNQNFSFGILQEELEERGSPSLPSEQELTITKDMKFNRTYATLSSLHQKWGYKFGLGYNEWNDAIATKEDTHEFSYHAGVRLSPINSRTHIDFASWKKVSQYIPRGNSLEDGNLFSIITADNTGSHTQTHANAVNFTGSGENFYWSAGGHKKQFKLRNNLGGSNFFQDIEETSSDANLSLLLSPHLSSQLKAEYSDSGITDMRAIEINFPAYLTTTSVISSFKYFWSSSLNTSLELQYIKQNSKYLDAATSADEYVGFFSNKEEKVQLNLQMQIRTDPWVFDIRVNNLTDEQTSVFQRTLQERIESIAPTASSIPYRRSVFAIINFNI